MSQEVIELIVNDLLKIVNEHQLPLSKVKKGQILWQAVAKDETSSYGKSMSDIVNHTNFARIKLGNILTTNLLMSI